jgi:hypothetical protein
MRVVKLPEEAKRIERRRRELGLDDARVAVARNKGAARTMSSRAATRSKSPDVIAPPV